MNLNSKISFLNAVLADLKGDALADPLDRANASPLFREQYAAWLSSHAPSAQYEAWTEGDHPLSFLADFDSSELGLTEESSLSDWAEAYRKMCSEPLSAAARRILKKGYSI